MDIAIYQDALLNIQAFGQSIGAGLQSAIDVWTQGFNFSGGNAAVEANTGFAGLSSGLNAGAEAEAAVTAPEGTNGLELGLEAGVEANL